MLTGLVAEEPDNKTISIDVTYLKAHRTASSLRLKKGGRGRLITARQGIAQQMSRKGGRTKGGTTTKLPAVSDIKGERPLNPT